MKNVLTLAFTALLLFLAGSAWLALYPGVPVDLGGVANLDERAEKVRIPVGEDDHVDAWLLRGSRPGVIVFFAGYARDHHRAWRYAQFLHRDGWTILAPDFRSVRKANRKPTTVGFWEGLDARATLDWIAAQPEYRGQKVALFGESLGGSVALAVAADRRDVRAVVADCPFADADASIHDGLRYELGVPPWPATPLARALGRAITGHDPGALDVTAAVRAYGARPLMLIQSTKQDRFGIGEVERLEAAADSSAVLWRTPDAGHNQAWLVHRAEYERRVRAFFLAHMAHLAPARAASARAAAPRPAARVAAHRRAAAGAPA